MKKSQVVAKQIYGISNKMLEPEMNHLATSYLTEHYEELLLAAKKMNIDTSMCVDLVNDVFLSLQHSEANGEGYDPNKGKVSEYISIEQFVYGRLKNYSKNKKYRLQNPDTSIEVSASSNSGDLDELNQYQKAYEMAANYDDIEAVDINLSAEEELGNMLSFEKEINMNIRYFLKNLTMIAKMQADVSVFGELRKMKANKEFVESLKTLVVFAKNSPERYEALVANI